MSTNIVFEYINTFSSLEKKAFQVQESCLLGEPFSVVVL